MLAAGSPQTRYACPEPACHPGGHVPSRMGRSTDLFSGTYKLQYKDVFKAEFALVILWTKTNFILLLI
jgi:hypothetical protein